MIGVLLTPGVLLLLCLTGGTLLLWSKRHYRGGRRLLTALTVVLMVATLSPLQPFLTEMLETRFPVNPPLPERIDGVIILGGSIDPLNSKLFGQVSLNSAAERLTEGMRLALLHPEAHLLFSGGSADPWNPQMTEGPVARRLLIDLGFPQDRLSIEERSRNTYENALFSRDLMSPRPGENWVLVTSARHMPRSVGIFRQLGWNVIPWPVDFTPTGQEWVNRDLPLLRLVELSDIAHEWGGLIYYRLRGWTNAFLPSI